MSQLAFHWPAQANYTPEDFFISPANNAAVLFIDHWPENKSASAVLTGPAASGKTSLTHRWSARTGAHSLDSSLLGTIPSEQMWGKGQYAVLENIETILDQTAFFHLLRHVESSHCHLLMTSQYALQDLPFQLPDVRSRLLSCATANIHQPDEALLFAFLTKACADRQWRVSANVIHYLVLRTERSFAAAQSLIHKLEHVITTTNRELTIPLIKHLIE
jgi:chromosomal replication initiation ATPase DnaA